MTTETTKTQQDEAQIRQLIADQMQAICGKDLDRLMNHYAADAVMFDVKPPFQTKGVDAFRRMWEGASALLPGLLPDGDERPQRHRERRPGSCALAWAFHWHGKGASGNADLDTIHRRLPEDSGQMADRSRARLRPIQSGDWSSRIHSGTLAPSLEWDH